MRTKNIFSIIIVLFMLSGLLANSVFAKSLEPENGIPPSETKLEVKQSPPLEKMVHQISASASVIDEGTGNSGEHLDSIRLRDHRISSIGSGIPTEISLYNGTLPKETTKPSPQGSSPWQQLNKDGFGDNNFQIPSVQEFNGFLYAGTWKIVNEIVSAEVWKTSDGSEWEKVNDRGYNGCADMIVFGTYLYCGSWDGAIWRTEDGTSWVDIITNGFGDSNNGIARFAVFDGKLYASTWNDFTGTQIWQSTDGSSWSKFADGLDPANISNGAISSEVFDGYLYWGTVSEQAGAQIWRTDGTTLSQIPNPGFNSPGVSSLAAYNGYLYAGIYNHESSQVWRSADGMNWVRLLTFSDFGSANHAEVGLEVYNGMLYVVGANYDHGLEVWNTENGTDWEQVGYAGFGDSSNGWSFWDNAITTFDGKLIVATNNFNTGGEVWSYQPNDYEVYDVALMLNLGVRDQIWGNAKPGLNVTITTPRNTIETFAEPTCNGCFGIDEPIEIRPGDEITITAGAGFYPITFTVPNPLVVNASSTDQVVSGQIGGRINEWVDIDGEWNDGFQHVMTDSLGNFTASYSDMPRGAEGVVHFASIEDEAEVNYHQYFRTPDLILDVFPFGDKIEGPYAPGHTITLTVKDSEDTIKAVATVTTGEIEWWDGRTGFATELDDLYWNPSRPEILPGDSVYGEVEGGVYTSYVKVGQITGNVDVENDSISGTVDAQWFIPDPGVLTVECLPWGAPAGVPSKTDTVSPNGTDPYICAWDPTNEWNIEPNQWIGVGYRDPQNNRVIEAFFEPDYNLNLNVHYGEDWIEFGYPSGYDGSLVVTESDGVTDKASVEFTTAEVPWWNGETGFSTNMEGVVWNTEKPDIQVGDWVFGEIDVNGVTYEAEVQVGEITGEVDTENNSITGTINASWLPQGTEVGIWCHPWGAPPNTEGKSDSVLPNGTDTYSCSWDPETEWDIQPGERIGVSYMTSDNQSVFNSFVGYSDELIFYVQYDHDWIQGTYEQGHTIFLQVLDQAGLEKAHITLPTAYIPDWGRYGFDTNMEGAEWIPALPDIQPGDTIHGEVDDGSTYTADVKIGWVTADLNLDNDQVTGTLTAEWLPQSEEIMVSCEIWDWNSPPNQEDWVLPDGLDTYLCDWSAEGYDLNEASNLMVAYYDAAGHRLIGEFRHPAPRLRIENWLEGGEPGKGGNVTFNIQYRNEGNADAVNAILTDTFDQGLTYLGDTSGFTKTEDGNKVTWQLGDLAPGDWVNFYVFARVDALEGHDIINTAEISSESFDAGNPEDRVRSWQGTVVANDTHVNVGIGAWTWNPAPGKYYVYNINVCNNGSTGSTGLTLTETLPAATTLDSWWGREPGWSELSRNDNILTLSYPTIAGWRCQEVYVKVKLDESAQPGDEIINNVEINATNDDPNEQDNQAEFRHNVGEPVTELSIHMDWRSGVLTPGGQYRVGIHFHNDGNLPVEGPIPLTLTLPAGTSFTDWKQWDWAKFLGEPAVEGNTITWQVDDFDPGYYGSIEVFVDIDPNTAPGTELLHTCEIAVQPEEYMVENNTFTLTETVLAHGPNLRVRKYGEWHGFGESYNAWYQLTVENVGDRTVKNVVITDSYPEQMVLDGGINVGFWEQWDWEDFLEEHYFTISLDRLEPGWSVGADYNVLIPGEDPVPIGQVFTNTAAVTTDPADTNPEDNTAVFLLWSGLDLFIEKTLEEGEFKPGEEVTYLLRFGNAQSWTAWWWDMAGDAILTDTLPAGMTFVSAQIHWTKDLPEWTDFPPEVDGQTLTWQTYPFPSGHLNEIRLTVRIADDVQDGAELTNQVSITSNLPEVDLDPFPDNNTSTYTGIVDLGIKYLYLPLILK